MRGCGTRFAIDIDELKELANADVLNICNKILPNGRENCGYWEVGSVAGEPGKTLKVNLRGASRGLWTDFAVSKGTPEHSGNIIQLVAVVQFGGRVGEALTWLRRWLGLDHLNADDMAKQKAAAARSAAKSATDAIAKAESNRRKAHNLYLSAVPYPDTPVEAYLIARGLDFRAANLKAPGVLRYHSGAYCAETGGPLPCMVAAIHKLDGSHAGTHRTWIQPNGSGKAALVEAKKSIGKYQGGFIHLWKGEHRVPLRDLPPGTPIYVSEGIEDGLSAVLAKPSIRCIAGISLSNIGSLELPPDCPIHILGQRDEKQKAIDAFESSIARLQAKGHEVFIIYPPQGFKDYNDLIRRDGAASGGQVNVEG